MGREIAIVCIVLLVSSTSGLSPTQAQMPQSGGFSRITDIEIDFDHGYIITSGFPIGTDDYNLIIWEVSDAGYTTNYNFKQPQYVVYNSIEYNNNTIYAGANNGSLYSFSYHNDEWTFDGTLAFFKDMRILNVQMVSPTELMVVTQAEILIIDLADNNKIIETINPGDTNNDRIKRAKFQYRTQQILLQDFSQNVEFWFLNSSTPIRTYQNVVNFAADQNTDRFALVNSSITVRDHQNINISLPLIHSIDWLDSDVGFSTNSQYVAIVGSNTIEVFDTTNSSSIFSQNPGVTVLTIEWVNNYQFFTGDNNGTVTLWDIRENSSLPLYGVFGAGPNQSSGQVPNLSPFVQFTGLVALLLAVILIIFVYRNRKSTSHQQTPLKSKIQEIRRKRAEEKVQLYPDYKEEN